MANGTTNYARNAQNQYTSVGGTAYSYDGNGNLTGDGVWTYGYDLDNRLKTASKSGYTASLDYDAEGRSQDHARRHSKILYHKNNARAGL